MKNIIVLMILALALLLTSCVAVKVDENEGDEVKESVELPMIPADYKDVTGEEEEEKEKPAERPDKEIPDLDIIPEENETPAIPIE